MAALRAAPEEPDDGIVRCAAFGHRLAIDPAGGGRIVSFCSEHGNRAYHWLMTANGTWDEPTRPPKAGAFLMVPFPNRLESGRFAFAGRAIRLPAHPDSRPHALHGHGWLANWDVVSRELNTAEIAYRHAADAWPFDYEVRQLFTLTQSGLAIAVIVRNPGPDPMPFGLGFHPYIPLRSGTRLQANVSHEWRTDDQNLPLTPEPVQRGGPFGRLHAVAAAGFTRFFDGWNGIAKIQWPDENVALCIEAEETLSRLAVHIPHDRTYLCLEPATQTSNAFNLGIDGEDGGTRILAAGEEFQTKLKLNVTHGELL